MRIEESNTVCSLLWRAPDTFTVGRFGSHNAAHEGHKILCTLAQRGVGPERDAQPFHRGDVPRRGALERSVSLGAAGARLSCQTLGVTQPAPLPREQAHHRIPRHRSRAATGLNLRQWIQMQRVPQ